MEGILKSSGHQNNLKELKIKLENKLLENCGYEMCTQSRGSWHNRGGVIGFYTDTNAIGHVDFTVHPYPVNWAATKIRQSSNKENINVLVSFTAMRELSFADNYVFDSISNFKQIFPDFIPWIIAGEGEPFRITGKFTDSVSPEFIFSCPCNIINNHQTMRIIINISKCAFLIILLSLVYQLIEGDKCFYRRSGFSPRNFGTRHYTTLKQLITVQEYYEYNMNSGDFHNMRKNLYTSNDWEIETDCMFSFPQFEYNDSMDCDCFFLRRMSSNVLWMAYDERECILYAGYYQT